MKLIEAFVSSPVKVSVGVLMLILFGCVALLRMPMQLTPEVQTPTITVQTRWPGASPQEIEREIIIEQEEQLKSVESLTKLSSESSDSTGNITLEFRVGTNMDKAVVDVIGRLEQVPQYPEDADKPVISTSNASDRPIAWFILSAERPTTERIDEFAAAHPELKEGLDKARNAFNPGLAMLRLRNLAEEHPEVAELLPPPELEVTKLRRFAEDEIESRFERISGVSQANVLGGLEDELQVIIDPESLAARSLTIEDVRQVLRSQNTDVSAGDFWESKRRWVVRTLGQFRSPDQVANQLLAVRDGAPVYVRDVAEVKLGYKKPDGLVRRFGESSIAINALRETGANVLDVMSGLRAINEELNADILKKRGLVLTQVYDETDYIYSSVDLVQQNIFIGGALTMIVLMGFLHLGIRTLIIIPLILASSWAAAFVSPWFFAVTLAIIIIGGFWFARGALVVGLAIPVSIIGTFLVLQILGRSLNVISLAGMAFAVGMLVDNAVVVLENIYRRYESLGEKPFVAAVRGTQEVLGAVVASTLTTIAVFLPIVFIQQEAGQLFRDIALAISAAVALSMVVSMTVIPTSAARLFRREDEEDDDSSDVRAEQAVAPQNRGFFAGIQRSVLAPVNWFGKVFVGFVTSVNAWVQRGFIRRVALLTVLVCGAFYLTYAFWPKVEYLPTGNRNLVFGILLPPPGYNLDQLMEMGEQVERELKPYWDIEPDSPERAKLDFPMIGDFFFVARGRSVFLGIRAHNPMEVAKLVPLVSQVGSRLPGTFAVAKQSSLFEQGLTAGRTIDVEITGPELQKLVGLGGQIFGLVRGAIENVQARPVPSLDLSSPEIHVEPRLMQASQMGLNTTELGYAVNALVDGAYAGDYFLEGDKIDVTITGREKYADSIQNLRALPIATPIGQLVSLEAVATVNERSGPEQINHRERERSITIEVSPPQDMALEDAMAILRDDIIQPLRESGQLEGGYRVTLAGTADKLSSTWEALQFNVALALLITYLLMAALFESWLYPLVVIFSVPLGAVGGVLGLNALNWWLSRETGTIYGQPLDVLTMLGFVILIGTVVNNPILIVHQSLNLIREGMNRQAAILESVRTRIRPIFMTTLTTVLGLMPLVLFPGAGSELYRGLGSVVLGGLMVSTVFTLFLVPTLFSLTMDGKDAFVRLFVRKRKRKRIVVPEPKPEKDLVPAS
ncbi:efflux RND transporter permease subunit [Fuerstiella marisgermanici]|uniref:Acriflavine resistance protein B n=1 Tax=Fuerstiella marisgermanici TaxID=1891926 RepID=A0A1P8W9F2_9PLAN|nr:efflux RND transporter permease subunit [Fuerstiella marisgermanici]APZ90661.1 Acriflavine resistance protein B [Fuerstiella marisgermanici]